MSALARYLARLLWGAMLWTMRRPWIKHLQRSSLRAVPGPLRARARVSFNRQNAFARKYGLTMLTVAINIFLASATITICYQLAQSLVDSGILEAPSWMRDRVAGD